MREPRTAHLEIVETEIAQAAERLRPLVERRQLLPADRPAAVGDPVPAREVLLVQGPAISKPVVGAAADVPEGRGIEHEAWWRSGRDAVDTLVAVAAREAAPLQ